MSTITAKTNNIIINSSVYTLVLFAALLLLASLGIDFSDSITKWAAQENNLVIAIFVSIVLMVLCAMTPLPAEAMALANGMIFGPLGGAIITWTSAVMGAYITFRVSKRCKNSLLTKPVDKKKWAKVNNWIERWGTLGFLVARLIPAVPFFALNIGAAFLPITTRTYLLITGLAIIPHVLIFSFFGGLLTSS